MPPMRFLKREGDLDPVLPSRIVGVAEITNTGQIPEEEKDRYLLAMVRGEGFTLPHDWSNRWEGGWKWKQRQARPPFGDVSSRQIMKTSSSPLRPESCIFENGKVFLLRMQPILSVDPRRWRCECGSAFDLAFKAKFPIQKIVKRDPTLWRYREALPILKDGSILSMGEGFTPLEEMTFNRHRVLVKIDYLFPTGSYKDRGATVLISKMRELGIREVIEDSSGNGGQPLRLTVARRESGAKIYVPESTSSEKLVQIQSYGATLVKVRGSREKTAEKAIEAASRMYYASHCWNPFFLHGTKTFAFEIWEQMGWKAPDILILPVGHGTLLLGAYLGFKELKETGMVNRIPKIVGVQSTACAPLYQAFKRGLKRILHREKGDPCRGNCHCRSCQRKADLEGGQGDGGKDSGRHRGRDWAGCERDGAERTLH